jgi:hypothetical protein
MPNYQIKIPIQHSAMTVNRTFKVYHKSMDAKIFIQTREAEASKVAKNKWVFLNKFLGP